MNPGTLISGAAHLALIVWVLFGGAFSREPLPAPEVADVTVLSEEEFAALTAPPAAEMPQTSPPESVAPDVAAESPPPGLPDAPADPAPPAPAPEAAPAPPPPNAAPATPVPDDSRPDALPEPPPPPPAAALPPAERDVPRPAPRVATEATPPPPLEAETAPEVVEAPDPDPAPEALPIEEETPAAPEEATTEIVTEAEEPAARIEAAAPVATRRPPRRPPPAPLDVAEAEPEPPSEPEPEPVVPRSEVSSSAASSENVQDAVGDLLAELERAQDAPPAQQGPPMNFSEKEAFSVSVSNCWIVDPGSQSADVTVTVAFSLTPDRKLVEGSLRQVSASGGSEASVRAAYEKASRAIQMCQNRNGGFALPQDKYDQWRDVEITFEPSGMRMR